MVFIPISVAQHPRAAAESMDYGVDAPGPEYRARLHVNSAENANKFCAGGTVRIVSELVAITIFKLPVSIIQPNRSRTKRVISSPENMI